jgi:hypothetical protein
MVKIMSPGSFKTSVSIYHSTRFNIPEDLNLLENILCEIPPDVLSTETRLRFFTRLKLYPAPLVACNGSVFIIRRQMRHERTMVVGDVTGMWKRSWHNFRNHTTINVGWKRKTTDLYQWCPVPPKFWPSALLAFAWRCISGDVTIRGIRGWASRCFVCCVLHFVFSRDDVCWSKGRLSLNSISSLHTLVWTDGLTVGTRQ